MTGVISMKRLAEEIGMDRSACRRYVLSLGIQPQRRRTSDSGFQVALTLTREQADRVKKARSDDGYLPQQATIPTKALSDYSADELLAEIRRRIQAT